MARFIDGPAAGVYLELRRAPIMLRVVCSGKGQWDALDQLDDLPLWNETVHVYRMRGDPITYHVCRSPRSKSGWHNDSEYVVWPTPPPDETLRDNAAWAAWTDQIKSEVEAIRAAEK